MVLTILWDGWAKIADFGMSRILMDNDYYKSQGGVVPVKWTAPEVSASPFYK